MTRTPNILGKMEREREREREKGEERDSEGRRERKPKLHFPTSQVVSFDQLYIQALLVHDELIYKCKSWALQSGA